MFDYHEPTTIEEAVGLLRRHAGDVRLMAGGTAMVLLMSQGLVQPQHVIGLRGIESLRGLQHRPDGGLRIGALVTHAEASRSPVLGAFSRALQSAFAEVGTVRIRNQGTVGGNLAHADPAHDPPPMLLALDAFVTAVSSRGERQIPLTELFVDFYQTSLADDEILTGVVLPLAAGIAHAAYVKFLPRTRDDYATVAAAVWLRRHVDGRCLEARIALGAAGPVAVRARRAEELLRGALLEPRVLADAAALARDDVDPLDDARGSAAYKREMARVWVERALLQALAAKTSDAADAAPPVPPVTSRDEGP